MTVLSLGLSILRLISMMLNHLFSLFHVACDVVLFAGSLELATKLLVLDLYLVHLWIELHGRILHIERTVQRKRS